jgi:hypothetical protein
MLENCADISEPDKWFVGNESQEGGEYTKYGSMKGFSDMADLLEESYRS